MKELAKTPGLEEKPKTASNRGKTEDSEDEFDRALPRARPFKIPKKTTVQNPAEKDTELMKSKYKHHATKVLHHTSKQTQLINSRMSNSLANGFIPTLQTKTTLSADLKQEWDGNLLKSGKEA